jgi:hypothetical protein
LEHADLGDRGGELAQRLLVEVNPRLMRIRRDVGDRHFDQRRWAAAVRRRRLGEGDE